MSLQNPPLRIGRYLLFDPIASGGMATVHYGRLLGQAGFARTIAIKRLHPHLAGEQEFVSRFLDEARLAARIRHPNVVATLDVVQEANEVFLVLEYVEGETLAKLLRLWAQDTGEPTPLRIAAAVLVGTLAGLQAAHEATNEGGRPLALVHRDISPQNILVGADGLVRVADFGIAQASERLHATDTGQLRGKLRYMAPEQLQCLGVDRRTDVYSAAVVLWEAVTGRKRTSEGAEGQAARDSEETFPPPSRLVPSLPTELDSILARALQRDPNQRYPTAGAMAAALEAACPVASQSELAHWVQRVARELLQQRARKVAEIEAITERSSLAAAQRAKAELAPQAERSDKHVVERAPSAGGGDATRDYTAQSGTPSVRQPETPSVEGEEATQLWKGSSPSALPGRRSWLLASALLGVVGVTVLMVLLLSRSGSSTQVFSAASSSASSEEVQPQLSLSNTTLVDSSVAKGAEPTPSGSSSATRTPVLPKRLPVSPSRPGCDPPYTLDKEGVKVPKRHCFP